MSLDLQDYTKQHVTIEGPDGVYLGREFDKLSQSISKSNATLNSALGGSFLPTFSGVIINAPASTLDAGITITQAGAGSTGGTQQYYNYINVLSDDADCGSSAATSYALALLVNYAFGGTSARGGREGCFAALTQTAPTATDNAVRFYTAMSGQAQANCSDGGTIYNTAITGAANNGSGLIRLAMASTASFTTGDQVYVQSVNGTYEANGVWIITVVDGTHIDLQGSTFTHAYTSGGVIGLEKGEHYGSNMLGVLHGGYSATGFKAVGASLDQVSVISGASVKTKAINALVYHSLDAVQGSSYDAALMISAEYGASAGGKYGILFGDMFGAAPLASSATVLGTTGTGTVANGIDLSGYTVTGSAFKSAGFSVSGSGQLIAGGTTTNDNAAAGELGEYVSSDVASGSAVSLTNATPVTVTSISLSAGDWDVNGIINFTGGSTTVINYLVTSLSTTNNTVDTTNGREIFMPCFGSTPFAYSGTVSVLIGPARFSLASTTTIYIVAQSGFGTSTNTAYGLLRARRVR